MAYFSLSTGTLVLFFLGALLLSGFYDSLAIDLGLTLVCVAVYILNVRHQLLWAAWILVIGCSTVLGYGAVTLDPYNLVYLAGMPLMAGLLIGPRAVLLLLGCELVLDLCMVLWKPGIVFLPAGNSYVRPDGIIVLHVVNALFMAILGWYFGAMSRELIVNATQDHKRIQEAYQNLIEAERRAAHDGLTGVYNHVTFQRRIAETFAESRRHAVPLAVLMIDIDHFKRINDTYGHPTGDVVLRNVAHALKLSVRESDCVARYGGEEFVIAVSHTDQSGAQVLAQRIQQQIRILPVVSEDSRPVPVTVSIGIAQLDNRDQTVSDLIQRADQALYGAKADGRNRVRASVIG